MGHTAPAGLRDMWYRCLAGLLKLSVVHGVALWRAHQALTARRMLERALVECSSTACLLVALHRRAYYVHTRRSQSLACHVRGDHGRIPGCTAVTSRLLYDSDMFVSVCPSQTPGYCVAYVGNIAFEATEADLRAVFEGLAVARVRMHTDAASGRFKGYAHVHFSDEASLDSCAPGPQKALRQPLLRAKAMGHHC